MSTFGSESLYFYHRVNLHTEDDFHRLLEQLEAKESGPIECDLFLLNDGNMIVIHNKDHQLSEKEVEERSVNELAIRSAEIVFRLEDYLHLIGENDLQVQFELKGSSTAKTIESAQVFMEKVKQMYDHAQIDGDDIKHSIRISSFSPEALREARKANKEIISPVEQVLLWTSSPDYARQLEITNDILEKEVPRGGVEEIIWLRKGIGMAKSLECSVINFNQAALLAYPEIIGEVHSQGLIIQSGVVDNEDERVRLHDLGVDEVLNN